MNQKHSKHSLFIHVVFYESQGMWKEQGLKKHSKKYKSDFMQLFSANGTVFLRKFKKPSSKVAHNS